MARWSSLKVTHYLVWLACKTWLFYIQYRYHNGRMYGSRKVWGLLRRRPHKYATPDRLLCEFYR